MNSDEYTPLMIPTTSGSVNSLMDCILKMIAYTSSVSTAINVVSEVLTDLDSDW